MATAGQETAFTDTSLNNPTSFEWDFGDGTPKVATAQRTVKHTYVKAGAFIVMHKAANACGAQSCIKVVEVKEAAPTKEGIGAGAVLGIGLLAAGVLGAVIMGRR